jgi:uncharacterized repeat protein (TIGR02543 family)
MQEEKMRRAEFISRWIIRAVLVFGFCAPALAQNATTPGTATANATILCIGIEWPITGDADHDATCTTQYRESGSGTWLNAQPLMRCDNSDHNGFYGSIFYLSPGTTYDIQLHLVDPDGGDIWKSLSATTRSVPVQPTGGRTFHVIPGSGGGDGSFASPFQGIAAAEAVAVAGDIFLLHAGDYGLALLTKAGGSGNPIVWKAAGDGNAIIQGMTIKSWVWIDELYFQAGSEHIQNNDWLSYSRSNALTVPDGSNASNVFVTRCTFRGFFHTIKCHGGSSWYIADNDIRGIADPLTGGLQGEGIEPDNSNSIICYNVIKRTADPISYPAGNTDIYGNEIQDAADDGVETDKGRTNVRIFNNRLTNVCNNVFTFQPMGWGPWYFIRNQVVLTRGKLWKFAQNVDDRFFVAHNTFIIPKIASEYAQCLLNSVHKNNLYIAYTDEDNLFRARFSDGISEPGLPYMLPFWMTDVDYDGFDLGGKAAPFQWFGTVYTTLSSFVAAVGIETHGRVVDRTQIFENWAVPSTVYDHTPVNFTLKAGANAAVDAGIYLANISEGYTGTAPDLGVYERGVPPPQYGPRPLVPPGDYVLTVTSGSGDGSYAEGAVAPIMAEAAATGMMFDRWTGDTQYVANYQAASTTVTMPAANVAVTATYTVEVFYTLTVNSGTGDGSYIPNTVVGIVADAPQNGYAFSAWTGDIDHVGDPNASSTTVVMPSHAVTVTATYIAVPMYTLTVNSGTGDGSYSAGTVVDISADPPPAGMFFSRWIGDTGTVASVNSSSTTLTMPAANATVTATYTDVPPSVNDAFLEANGFVCMEVEHYTSKAPGTGTYSTFAWELNTGISGASGDCMQALPNSGVNSGDATAGPVMDYKICFTTTGVYYLLLRMPAQLSGGDDSCNAGMDGVVFQSQVANPTGAWAWRKAAATTTISSTGLHTFGIWMREDGCITDKIILTTNSNYAPAGTDPGPIESPFIPPAGAYTLTVTSGSGDGSYDEGTVVPITADAAPAGKAFGEWTGDVAYVANANSASTTVTMPAANVSVTAVYYVLPTYTLTVNSGSGDGSYVQGAVVPITADTAPAGKIFDEWTGDIAYVANVNSASTTVTMPAASVTVTATYVTAVMYTLTVNSGSGDGSYAEDAVVPISADAAPAGKVFDEWTGDIAYVANVNASSTTVTMPASNVTVTATYIDYTPPTTPDYSQDEFQYKFTMGPATVWLYIPPATTKVRALLLMQQNVSEQKISVHPAIRQACNNSDVAVAWCSPGFDAQFQTDPIASHALIQTSFGAFGTTIGYPELGTVPLIAFGHSSTNGYAQRAAESRPERMLAVIATHGWDAIGKLTSVPPYFVNYAGPILSMIGCKWEMGQDESTFDSLTAVRGIPSLSNVATQCDDHWMPITKIDQNGSGHFDYDDEMMNIIGMFIEKSVAARLDASGNLIAVNRTTGWIAPGMSSTPTAPITIMPYSSGSAPTRDRCNWFFDQEFAEACADFVWGTGGWSRTYQMVWFNTSGGSPAPCGGNGFPDPVPFSIIAGTNRINIWAALQSAIPPDFDPDAAGRAIGHSSNPNVSVEYECGPYVYTDDSGIRHVKMTRGSTSGYLFARHPGDVTYRRAVQPGCHRLGAGGSVAISNPGDQLCGAIVNLPNNSTGSVYYGYYVNCGPARISGDGYTLEILQIPANTSGPLQVELHAYTLGTSGCTGDSSVTFNVSRGATTYVLTVNSGSGDGTYAQGAVVNIVAEAPQSGYVFDEWTGDVAYVANVNSTSTTVTMPADDVEVTATYQRVYTLTVNSGSGDGDYLSGTVVPIVADAPPAGQMFDQWTGDTDYVTNVNSASTAVTMPAANVTVTATYVPEVRYTLTVNTGSGDGSYLAGEEVPIQADAPAAGLMFDQWTGDVQYLADPQAASTTVTMPEADVTVTAAYTEALYTLVVVSGSGDGQYTMGTVVPISADAPAAGREFDQWTGDVQYLADANAAATSVTMPAAGVTVTATYKDILYTLTVNSGSGSGQYTMGTVVPISADTAPAGKVFDEWIGDTATVANVGSANTTVTVGIANITVTATYADILYVLKVANGSGDGRYAEGVVVSVAADPPDPGYTFDCWSGDTATVANVHSSGTTVTMPAANVSLAANYRPFFTLTVNHGSGGGVYPSGTIVDISADAPVGGEMFDCWTGDTATVANVLSAGTTVTIMSDVTVTATYRRPVQLTVVSGSGSGAYMPGTVVPISADPPVGGEMFDRWTGDTATVANVNSSSTTVTMPGVDVTVTATYRQPVHLTVNGGSGSGSYVPGAIVPISADAPSPGEVFYRWTGDTATVANVNASETTLTMPGVDATVTATYKLAPAESCVLTVNSGSGSGVYSEEDVVPITADTAPVDREFQKWIGDTECLADYRAASTTATMPAADVTVTAKYVSSLLRVTYPSDRAISLERGAKKVITWTAPGLGLKTLLKVELTDGVDTWVLTEKATAGKGVLKWTVGKWKSKTGQPVYPDGDAYTIRICTLDELVEDDSDEIFAIGEVASLDISGPDEVDENSTAQLTCTARFNLGDPQDYTNAKLKWSTSSKAAKVKLGTLTTKEVLADEPCTITAGYGKGTNYVEGTFDLTIMNR